MGKRVTDHKQLIIFRLGDEEFGVEISKVREVTKLPEITKLPNVPDYIEGVINLRGNVLPLINLHKCLGLKVAEKTSSTRVIVISSQNEGNVGIIVDFVSEVLHLDEKNIDSSSPVLGNRYIRGIAKINNRPIILLELRGILSAKKEGKLIKIKPFNQKLLLKRAGPKGN